jgi:hypothetical protein
MEPGDQGTSSEGLLKALNEMPAARLERLFKSLSPKAAVALIDSLKNPGILLNRLRDQDFFYLVKGVGEEDALPLLAFGTIDQILYCTDIEFWKKDVLYPPHIAKWIELFSKLEIDKIGEFTRNIDPELLVSILHPFVKVKTRNVDADYLEELDRLPSFTLENIFFLDFPEPNMESALKIILESLFISDSEYYFSVMLLLASGLFLETEEAALRFRRARLAEKGFPAFDEAYEIYEDPGPLRQGPNPEVSVNQSDRQNYEYPGLSLPYPLQSIDPGSLFMRCLNQLDDSAERDRISLELANLANKIMIADGLDPSELEDLHSSLRKASGYINIALQEVCTDSLSLARTYLQDHHMETLFRRGFHSILSLRKDVMRFIRKYEGGIENLGYPLALLLRELLKKRPLFAAQVTGESKSRDFLSKAELDLVRSFLNEKTMEESWEHL